MLNLQFLEVRICARKIGPDKGSAANEMPPAGNKTQDKFAELLNPP